MAQSQASFNMKTLPFSNTGRTALKTDKAEELSDDRSIKSVSIIIPAFNEEMAVRETVIELRRLFDVTDIDAEIIVVDDGSKDKTAREAKAAGARVIQHRSNRGYGASLKTGIIAASHNIIAPKKPVANW